MTINLKENERIDDLQRNHLKIIQDPERFCFGMDAVLLSGFCCNRIKKGESVVDFCTGTGIIPILLSAKTEASQLVGIEIQEESAEMADRSVRLNELQNRVKILCADVKNAGELIGKGNAQSVTCNPPYMINNHGLKNDFSPKTIARHEVLCTLEDVIREASYILENGGRLFMVHRPFRLAEIFGVLSKYKLEPKRMQLVYPYIHKEPNMVLLEAVKGGRSRLEVEKPLIIYKDKGKYTDEIYDIYGY